MSNTEFNVGDPVKVYHEDPIYEFYILGRIISINHYVDKVKYSVLYYSKNNSNLQTIREVEKDRLKSFPEGNFAGCPSHSITMEYVDDLVRKERQSEGTPIKNMQIGGECTLTVVYQDDSEDSHWSFEEGENDTVILTTPEGEEVLTEEELEEHNVDHIVFMDTYTLWSKNTEDDVEYRASTDPRMPPRE